MTLDEAIIHCKEKAEELRKQTGCIECAKEHEQLAFWLEELKELREDNEKLQDEKEMLYRFVYGCKNEED